MPLITLTENWSFAEDGVNQKPFAKGDTVEVSDACYASALQVGVGEEPKSDPPKRTRGK